MIDKDRAIELALSKLHAEGIPISQEPPVAFRRDKGQMRGNNHCAGWLVIVEFSNKDYDPHSIHVEVYDPDGLIYIPPCF